MDDTRVTTKYCDHCWATNFHYCNIHEIKRKVEYESTNCAMLSEEGIFSLKFQPAVAILQANNLFFMQRQFSGPNKSYENYFRDVRTNQNPQTFYASSYHSRRKRIFIEVYVF